jgi:hypothetical protein
MVAGILENVEDWQVSTLEVIAFGAVCIFVGFIIDRLCLRRGTNERR